MIAPLIASAAILALVFALPHAAVRRSTTALYRKIRRRP
jgi:hypothetical protein